MNSAESKPAFKCRAETAGERCCVANVCVRLFFVMGVALDALPLDQFTVSVRFWVRIKLAEPDVNVPVTVSV